MAIESQIMSLFDYSPSGYREWFINSGKFRFGNPNRAEVFAAQPIQDVVGVTVLEAQIPYTFYTINPENNVVAVVKTTGGAPVGYTLTLTPGNYAPDTLCNALTSLNCNIWPSGAGAGAPLFTAATYNGAVGKLSLTVNSAVASGGGWFLYTNDDQYGALPVAAIGYGLLPPTKLCIEPLGAADIRAPQDIAISPGTPFTLPYTIALGGPPYLAIRGNFGIGGSDNIIMCDEGSSEQKYGGNVLAMIPINTIPGGTITWKNLSPRGGFFSLSAATIESATFWVTTGDDDAQVDFNGHGFQFKLGFILRNRGGAISGSRFTNDRQVTSSAM